MREIRFRNSHDASMYNKGYEQGRADAIEEFEDWLFDQDEIFFPLEAITIIREKLEELKEQKNE